MSIIDLLAEQHILAAQRSGELDNLSGAGQPLQLDDDSHVPAELRAGYRILKNSGYLPPELELRREAIELSDLLHSIDPNDARYHQQAKRLKLLEIKLREAGISTTFLHSSYASRLQQRFTGEE